MTSAFAAGDLDTMNRADVLKPLLAHLEPFYGESGKGLCEFIAGDVQTAIMKGDRPDELHSYGRVSVQIVFDGQPDIILEGDEKPMPRVTRNRTMTFVRAARGLWLPSGDTLDTLTATPHTVVLCRMVDGTFAVLDGNEGQFSHIEGDCTIHVREDDLQMKNAMLSKPAAS